MSSSRLLRVGKESNKLEDVEAGFEHDADSIWTEYEDPKRDPWGTEVLPILRQFQHADLASATGLSERALRAIRNGHARPKHVVREALTRLAENSMPPPISTRVLR
jgi:hypothetical protein